MSDGRDRVAELEAELDDERRRMARLRKALYEIWLDHSEMTPPRVRTIAKKALGEV